MLEADLTGADAHGVFRLPQYIRRIKAGGVNPKPSITVEKTAPATAMVDGDNGMGHLVMQRAADTAIALAKESGVAWVGARRSNHAGAAGTYAAMALPHDMIGIYSAVANANHMPAWGAAESLLSTNPIAMAVPAGEEPPVVLDIATTVVSYGTVKAYKLQGKPMPAGWMVSAKDGKPITDSAKSAEGLLMPIGGHKGSGLALVLGLLAGVLNGAAFGREVVDFNADDESRVRPAGQGAVGRRARQGEDAQRGGADAARRSEVMAQANGSRVAAPAIAALIRTRWWRSACRRRRGQGRRVDARGRSHRRRRAWRVPVAAVHPAHQGGRRQSEGAASPSSRPRRPPRWSTATTAWAIWSCSAPPTPRSRWRRRTAWPGSARGGAITPARRHLRGDDRCRTT